MNASNEVIRCPWVPVKNPVYTAYHDEEWGVPVYDSQALFAKLLLDGAQAGLTWWSILQRRDGYYRAFDGFDPEKMARYDEVKIAALLEDPGIIRNRAKVRAFIQNARAYLEIEQKPGEFSTFLWSFVDGQPRINHNRTLSDFPAQTDASQAMSKALVKAGFSFVGPTICYAFMQAVGMVNDHTVDCFRYHAVMK